MHITNQTLSRNLNRRQILKYALYGGLTTGLSPGYWLTGCTKRPGRKGPNIILITIDTVRSDHLSCYGYHRNTSPNIDRFAEDAMLFENCFSHGPDTRISCASLLSGFLPHETKISQTGRLLPEINTLPKRLSSLGYKTAAVVSNYVLRKKWGWADGFMIYDETMNERELIRKWPERTAQYTTDAAVKILNQLSNDPFFLWVHYQDPHGPYTPPESFIKLFKDPQKKPRNIRVNKSLTGRGGIPSYQKLPDTADYYDYIARYDAEIRYADDQFKRLLDALRQLNLYDNALIIFSSDHGEGMGEHDYYFAHGENLYNSLIHVPLIVKHGSELIGIKNNFVQHLDIVPTALDFAGINYDAPFRGRDLCKNHETRNEIFARVRNIFSIIHNGFKLIYTHRNRKYELYNINTDKTEEHNLIDNTEYRTHAMDLMKKMKQLVEEDKLKLNITRKQYKLTPEEMEKLKSLGYTR